MRASCSVLKLCPRCYERDGPDHPGRGDPTSPRTSQRHGRTCDTFPGTPLQHTGPDQTQMTFRPSTSPLTHSSPSQTSFPSQDGTVSSSSQGGGVAGGGPPNGLSPPHSQCHSESTGFGLE
ncbi:hypothetical protein DPEC_G00363570 [Dallia pectoralis]|nr:hypothetical protein DPEC_G00363570 [Dallia pectoralis]